MRGKLGIESGKTQRFIAKVVFVVFLLTLTNALWVLPARAASLTSMSDTLSTIKESVVANHTISFVTPTGVTAGQTITLTFPTGFNMGSVAFGDMDMATGASCPGTTEVTLAATPSGTTWGAAKSGQVVTFTSGTGTVTATNCVTFEIGTNATAGGTGVNQITNQTAVQNNSDPKILIGGTMADSGRLAVEIVSNNNLAVTAAVDPTISCTIASTNGDGDSNPNTTTFGTFAVNTVTTATDVPTWTISTNALSGYNLGVYDTGNGSGTAGLYNSLATYTIASATADLNTAPSGYGLQGTKTNGDAGSATTTVQSPYTAAGTNVGALLTTPVPGAGTTLASATGPVSNATVTSTLKAKTSGLVPTGSYADTLTFVCTGIF